MGTLKAIVADGKRRMEGLTLSGKWEEYTDAGYNVKLWHRFWKKVYRGKLTDSILDFGCGSCWGGFVAYRLGYSAHCNLDINTPDTRDIFGQYANRLGQFVNYYDGLELPFPDDHFDSVVAKASILKLVNSEIDNLVRELVRVCKGGASIYVASKGMYFRFMEIIQKHNLTSILDEKNIRIIGWTWSILEVNRSKTIFTEIYFLYRLRTALRRLIGR